MSRDHRRFRAECQRAMDMGIQLIVLIEEMPPFGEVDLWQVPIFKGSNKYHRYGEPMTLVRPEALKKADEVLQQSVQGITDLINMPALMVLTLMQDLELNTKKVFTT